MSDPAAAMDSLRPLAVVAGATGFIGRQLCLQLQESGYRVKALVRPSSAANTDDLAADQIVLIDLADPALADELRGASVVFNLAGKAHTGVKDRHALQSGNVDSAAALAIATRQAGVPTLIHFSSILARNPKQSAYAASKLAGETAVLKLANENFSVIVVRPASVYGSGMRGNWMSLIRLIAARRLPPLPRLDNSIQLVGVQDLCRAAILLAASNEIASGECKIFAITDGQHYTPTAIESAIYAALGRKKSRWHSPRVLFFAAAVAAELLGRLGLSKSGFGSGFNLGSYQNLVSESRVRAAGESRLEEVINYQPATTFFTALPVLVEHAQNKN